MRIGYSFWGFLGPGITDTPDGGRSHRATLIDGLTAAKAVTHYRLRGAGAALVFNGVPHQICSFHVIKELTLSILHALAKVRKEMKAKLPPLPRGRPRKARRRRVQPRPPRRSRSWT